MNNELPLDMEVIKLGIQEIKAVIAESKPDASTEEVRRGLAPVIFHQASANLRNGVCAGMDPERWWQVAETMQYAVDWWAMTGHLYEAPESLVPEGMIE